MAAKAAKLAQVGQFYFGGEGQFYIGANMLPRERTVTDWPV